VDSKRKAFDQGYADGKAGNVRVNRKGEPIVPYPDDPESQKAYGRGFQLGWAERRDRQKLGLRSKSIVGREGLKYPKPGGGDRIVVTPPGWLGDTTVRRKGGGGRKHRVRKPR
jgi:hypothetical protein